MIPDILHFDDLNIQNVRKPKAENTYFDVK